LVVTTTCTALAPSKSTTLSAPKSKLKYKSPKPKTLDSKKFYGVQARGGVGIGATHFLDSTTPLLFDLDDFAFECKISNHIDQRQGTAYDIRFCQSGAVDFGLHKNRFSVRSGIGYDPITTTFGRSVFAQIPSLKIQTVHETQIATISCAYIPIAGLGLMSIPLTRSPSNILMSTVQAHSVSQPSISGAMGCSVCTIDNKLAAQLIGRLSTQVHNFDINAETQLLHQSAYNSAIHNFTCKYNTSEQAMIGFNAKVVGSQNKPQLYALGKYNLQYIILQCKCGLNTYNKQLQATYTTSPKQDCSAAVDLQVGQNSRGSCWCGVALGARFKLAAEFKS
jgi:hypothetical protein